MWLKLVSVAVALAALGVGTLATRAPVPAAEPTTSTTAVAGPPPTPAAGEQAVEFTEAELTDQLNQRLAGKPLADTPLGRATLTRIAAQFRTNQFVLSGEANVGGSNLPVSASGHIDLESGRPMVTVSDATAGGVSLPGRARDAVRQVVQEQIDAELARQGLHVKSLTITTGLLRLIGSH